MKNKVFLAATLGLMLTALVWSKYPTSSEGVISAQVVSASEFQSKLMAAPEAVLIDVRTSAEFTAGHIEKAVNIDFENKTFATEIAKLSKDVPYFVYCRSGNRSAQAVSLMKKAGIKNIVELRGGVAASPELLQSSQETAEIKSESITIDVGASTTDSVVFNQAVSGLSEIEKEGLIYMREEEKLAHDVYSTLGSKWGIQIFSNIASSEQTHTEAVRSLLLRYGIPDPVTNSAVGVFTNPQLQKLYTDLVSSGSKSLVDALLVGATIEDLDIFDLQTRITQTDKTDIKTVYENLMKGSRNHLRSFYGQIIDKNATYAAQYVSDAELIAIVNSEKETGGGMKRGRN